ncbi:MAG: AMP-binding protein [Myxococcota bacterium]
MSGLGQLLVDSLLAFRGETAVVEVRRRTITQEVGYDGLLDRCAALASVLSERIEPGDRVVILAENQVAWLVAGVATWWVGGVLVPIDARLEPGEQAALVAHAKPALAIGDAALLDSLPHVPCPALAIDGPGWPEPDAAAFPSVAPCDPESRATLVYTSGTGGTPRACVLSHRAYLAQWRALVQVAPIAPGDRWFSFLPTNHAIDFMCGFIGPLCTGATIVHQRVLRPENLLWTLRNLDITHLAVVPALLEAFRKGVETAIDARPPWQQTAHGLLVELGSRFQSPDVKRHLLPHVRTSLGPRLRRMYCGGAAARPDTLRFFHELGVPVAVGYGLTEACTVISLQDAASPRTDTVGRVLPGLELRIADRDADGVGEVEVRGDTLMSGYLDDPAATAAAFTADGFLRTGDLGRLDPTGELCLVGRVRDIIVTSAGKNVYPEDVERGLGVLPCDDLAVFSATFLWPERGVGGHAEDLIAVCHGGEPSDVARALVEAQRARPARTRVRGVVAFPEPFPRTSSRKLQRGVLAEKVRALGLAAVEL